MQDTLARKLRVLRAERGWTLREAAERTGVDKGTLSMLERGIRHPHDITLARLARGYGVPAEELLEEPALAGKADAPESGRQAPEREKREPFVSRVVFWSPYVDSPTDFEEASEQALEAFRSMRARLDDSPFRRRSRLAILDDGKVMEVVVAIPNFRSQKSLDNAWQFLGLPAMEGETVNWGVGIVTEDPTEFDPAEAFRRTRT